MAAEEDPFYPAEDQELRDRYWVRRWIDKVGRGAGGLERARERRRSVVGDGEAIKGYAFVDLEDAAPDAAFVALAPPPAVKRGG